MERGRLGGVPQPQAMLMLQFLAWLAENPRSYAEVMDAWRTSCPRLSIWEDAQLEGLVELRGGDEPTIALSSRGRALLAAVPPDGGRSPSDEARRSISC